MAFNSLLIKNYQLLYCACFFVSYSLICESLIDTSIMNLFLFIFTITKGLFWLINNRIFFQNFSCYNWIFFQFKTTRFLLFNWGINLYFTVNLSLISGYRLRFRRNIRALLKTDCVRICSIGIIATWYYSSRSVTAYNRYRK